MDSLTLFFFFLFMAFELFEANWQKSESLYGVIYNNYLVYQKSLSSFFILNPTFFYVLFLIFYWQVDSWLMYSMLFVKFIDVAFKLSMMNKIRQGQKIEEIMPLNIKMGFFYRYMNVAIYPITFLFAVVS